MISGQSSQNELLEAWSEIVFDYSSLIKTEKSDHLFNLQKEIGLLQWHVIYVDFALVYLREKYNEYFAGELRGLGYEVPLFDDENYQKALNRIESLAKTQVFELSTLRDEYDRLTKITEGKKQTEEEWVRTIFQLSKYQGYNLDRNKITVYDFTQVFNNYLSEMRVREKAVAHE